jgi:cytosine/adenosine deaminase-related metal-dependent hydrolase
MKESTYGMVYDPDHMIPVEIVTEDNRVISITETIREDHTRIILPGFVNAHTHIGDCGIGIEPFGTVKELVAPPDGLKHKMYREVSIHERMEYSRKAVEGMLSEGITHFIDFREEGVDGTVMLRSILSGIEGIEGRIMSVPSLQNFDIKEVNKLISVSQGIAVSGLAEWDLDVLSTLRKFTKNAKKKFTIHFSEDKREDVEKLIEIAPDYIVHGTFCTETDLARIHEHGIKIVVCPRANLFFGNVAPLKVMLTLGIKPLLGTDNCFINRPSIFAEMELSYKLFHHTGIDARDILAMATFNAYNAMGIDHLEYPDLDINKTFITFRMSERDAKHPEYAIVNFGTSDRIEDIFINGLKKNRLSTTYH